MPVTIATLDFKSREQLHRLPQTVENHIEVLREDSEFSSYSSDGANMKGIDNDSITEVRS